MQANLACRSGSLPSASQSDSPMPLHPTSGLIHSITNDNFGERHSPACLSSSVSQMETEYPSHIESWLAIVLVGAPLLVVAVGVFTLANSPGTGIVTIITGLIVSVIVAALSFPCVYTLTDENLMIKSRMIEEEVPLRKIRRAEKSGSMWSAPALSTRRIKITGDDGSRFISPEDRDGFITDLEARLAKAKKGQP